MPVTIQSVLIVDDNEADRYLLKRLIEQSSLAEEVFEATDGSDALSFMDDYDNNVEKYGAGFPPTLVFLDINMPKVNGFDFIERFGAMRKKRNYDSVIIVMYSSSVRKEDRDQAMAAPFVAGFMGKSTMSADEFRKTVATLTGLVDG